MSVFKQKKLRKPSVKSLRAGEYLRLREDVHRYMPTREWMFRRVEKDNTLLVLHESGRFSWNVKADDIDWEAYWRSKEKYVRGKQ